ncbi:MAG: trimeric intracellular cation channel family protein, partial [Pseudonocardia sp.]
VFDAAGLSLFCVVGALKALDYGLGPLPAALLGMLTAIGGGVLRDVLAGRVPVVLRGEIYATPALVGAAIAVLGVRAGLEPPVVAVPAALVCLVWRLLAIRRGWSAPRPSGAAST